jgi:hypothetical protein
MQIVYNPIRDNKLLTLLNMGRECPEFIIPAFESTPSAPQPGTSLDDNCVIPPIWS